MMPELEPERVTIDGQQQFNNFVQMYSAVYADELASVRQLAQSRIKPEMKAATKWAMLLKDKAEKAVTVARD